MIKAQIIRGPGVESEHRLHAVIINSEKEVIKEYGEKNLIVPARSTLKPFQSAAILKAGCFQKYNFKSNEIALTCASHNGQEKHVATAKKMLKKLNLKTSDLECGNHRPFLNKNKIKSTNLHNNCSGKHIAMLCLSKSINKEHHGYVNKKNAVQKHIIKYLETCLNNKIKQYAVDGCSAPTPFLSIQEIAYLYAKLISGKEAELNQIYKIIKQNPFMIAGDKRFDTHFIKKSITGVSKVGAEGLLAIGIKTKNQNIGICIKTEDGSNRVREAVAIEIMKKNKLLERAELKLFSNYIKKPILNHNKIKTGYTKVALNEK